MTKLIIAATTFVFCAGMSLADIVRMGTEGDYRPYNFINDAGGVDGFEREFGDELCKRTEMTCEWVTNAWDSIIPNLVSGKYDVIISAMSITDERDEVIDFTQNYIPPAPSAYVGLTAGANIKAGPVAVQTATIHASYLAKSGTTVLEFATEDDAIAAVRSGKAVALLADKDFLAKIVADSNGALTFVGDPIQIGQGIGLGVREADSARKAALDAGIQSMKDDGTLNAMIKKWFGDAAVVFGL